MSLETNLRSLVQRVATETKSLRTLLNGNTIDNSALTTTAKANLVAAINEVRDLAVQAAGGGATINDSGASRGAVFSSQETLDRLTALKAEIMGPNVNAALDTLKEIGDELASKGDALAALTTGLSKRLRFDASQTLTTAEQTQVRANIGAVSAADVGDTAYNYVSLFEQGLA